jgi:hypothetical protein
VVLNQGHNEMGLPMAAILYMWNLYTIFHLKRHQLDVYAGDKV